MNGNEIMQSQYLPSRPISPDDLRVGVYVVIKELSVNRGGQHDIELPHGLMQILARANSEWDAYKGVPLMVTAVNLPFIVVAHPIHGGVGRPMNTKEVTLMGCPEEYVRAVFGGLGRMHKLRHRIAMWLLGHSKPRREKEE